MVNMINMVKVNFKGIHFTNHIHFQALEVVYRGSETQLQVTGNLH